MRTIARKDLTIKKTLFSLVFVATSALILTSYLFFRERNSGRETPDIIIKAPFDFASDFSSGLALVRIGRYENEKSYYIDHTGKVVIAIASDSRTPFRVFPFSEGLAPIMIGFTDWAYYKGGKWGCIDKTAEIVIKPRFDYADAFSDGMGRIREGPHRGGKWGFVDKTGKLVIPPTFIHAENFKEGLAIVYVDGLWKDGSLAGGKWAFVDKTGRLTNVLKVDYLESFSEGLAKIRVGMKWGFVDKTGQIVIEPKFDDASHFSEGLAWVKVGVERVKGLPRGGKYGYIDKTGSVVIEPIYDQVSSFSEGLAVVLIGSSRKGDYCNYIDRSGKVVIKTKYNLAGDFSEGLACVAIGVLHEPSKPLDTTWGYIDKTGKTVIQPQFVDLVGDFHNGLAWVDVSPNRCRYNYIDTTGKFIFTPASNDLAPRLVADLGRGRTDATN